MFLLLLAAATVTSALPPPKTSVPAGVDVWHGTMSYPCTAECEHTGSWLCHDVPIKITVDDSTGLASMTWTWTVLPTEGGAVVKHCVVRTQGGLRVSIGANGQWFAKGDGTDAAFYSLEAKLAASGNALIDGVIYFSDGGSWPGTPAGTFNATKGGPLANATCVPPAPAPPAPPPTPKYSGPSLWPMPANITFGTSTVALAAHFEFHCNNCAVGSLLPTAFARYSSLIENSNGLSHKSTATATTDGPSLAGITVHVGSLEERKSLQLGMDESYSLTIPGEGANGVGSLRGA